uniref:VWFA domain-containing protein n=1 Tax=Apteryx owenii TaxID=8824 RepID=A0A8B9QH52_APTOW
MTPSTFEEVKRFISQTVSQLDVGLNKYSIGLVQFSGIGQVEFLLNTYENKEEVLDHIRHSVAFAGDSLQTESALEFLQETFFMDGAGSRLSEGTPQVVVVITPPGSRDNIMEAAWALEEMGVKVVSVDVGSSDREEAKARAPSTKAYQIYEGESEKRFVVLTYSFLLYFLVCKNLRADIVFLVDSSKSIRPAEFQKVKDFMQSFVTKVDVGLDNVRIGLLQFSSEIREEFQLDRYSTMTDLQRAIQEMQQIKTRTLTGKALTFAASYFDRYRGGRPELKQYLIVITDGKSQDPVKIPARAIRDKGITIYAIDMLKANNSQLLEIVGTQDKVFFENNLDFLEKHIRFEICNLENCKPSSRGRVLCRFCSNQVADLVFLIDGSRSISKSNFSVMKTFMKEIVDSFVISKEKVHVGVVQYSQDPQKEFSLNDFYTNTTIKEQIDSIEQLRSSTFTGKGLRFVRSLFEPANGGRNSQGVSQNLVVITDGIHTASKTEITNVPPQTFTPDEIAAKCQL